MTRRASVFDSAAPVTADGSSGVWWRRTGPIKTKYVAGDRWIRPIDAAAGAAYRAAAPVPAALVAAAPRYVTRVALRQTAARGQAAFHLGPDPAAYDRASDGGLTAAALADLRIALRWDGGGQTLAIAFDAAQDDAEPYTWRPANSAAVTAFVAAVLADPDPDPSGGAMTVALLHAGGGARVDFGDLTVPAPNPPWSRALRASAPDAAVLTALEVSHPDLAAPVRVVNDSRDHTLGGEAYTALRFEARLTDDTEGRAPRAELSIDNVGRDLMQWIEAAGGGVGATVRAMQFLAGESAPDWEMTLDVASVRADQERVTVQLGFDPLLGRSAVALRHDPQTSPGLF